MRVVDMRSDTVTLPSPAMREAMYRAEVGDDVLREDPTINRLQELAAEMTGHEAAMLTTSGTQANLVCQLTHTHPGNEVILGHEAHIFTSERGGGAALGGLMFRPVPNRHGALEPREVEAAIQPVLVGSPRTALICMENTHNRQGGVALTPQQQDAILAVARKHKIATHLDGARVFNAAVAQGIPVSRLASPFTSMMFCLSKGLAAPVGSVICSSKAFIDEARGYRRMLGGGMRQAGILAAAGIVALTQMVERLADDHSNARFLADVIADTPGLSIDLSTVQTNIIVFEINRPGMTADDLVERLDAQGVKIMAFTGTSDLRACTHYGIDREDMEYAARVIRQVMAA